MPNTVIDRLREERDEARDAAIALAEADNFDPQSESFRELEARSASLDGQIEHLAGLMERRQAGQALDGRLSAASRRNDPNETQARAETWGDTFVRSDAFANYAMRGSSSRLDVSPPETRALPTGISDLIAAGFKGSPTRVDLTPPEQPTPLLDAMTTINVSTNAIEYVSWAKTTGGAAKVAEKAAKPPVEYAPTVTSTALDMIAVYTQLTRQLMEDEAAVASAINNELRREILRAEEAEAAVVLNAAAGSIPEAESDTLMAAIRVAMGTVQAAGYNPNAVLLNPADFAQLDIWLMTNALMGPSGPSVNATPWGLSPIAHPGQTAGTALVGDFKTGVQHYARSQVQLYVTDSHADTFLANVFTLLAERRSKTAVVRPLALCEASAVVIP